MSCKIFTCFLISCQNVRSHSKWNSGKLFLLLFSLRGGGARTRTSFHTVYDDDPLTSFSLVGLFSLKGFIGFLLRSPLPPPRLPRSRWALGGAWPLAELEFVVFPVVAVCDAGFCDGWADDFSFALRSTGADVVELLFMLLLLVVLEPPALFE